ncbi:hypothetical protein GJ630_11455 [Haloarcula sp. CBA1122]|nr:hypothetical protein [Haloarcula sp. CBA1122]
MTGSATIPIAVMSVVSARLRTAPQDGYQPEHYQHAIVAIENQCTPDRTTAVRSVCTSFQLLL